MINSNKYYAKALNYYENGYIDKALEACEASISYDLKNKAALNLKGILYYLKGELSNAEAVWKLNTQINKDNVAQKYLHGLKLDYEKQTMFVEAVKLVNEVHINEAVELLKQCEHSDYNTINVNNYLCICYMKQCKYEEVKDRLAKVLQIDKKNEISLNIKKQLIEYEVIKKEINLKPIIGAAAIILAVAAIVISTKIIYKHIFSTKKTNLISEYNKNKVEQKAIIKQTPKQKQPESTTQTSVVVQFPAADFQKALNSKDFDSIYKYIMDWNDKNLGINDKKLLSEGQKLLANEGTIYFYKNGNLFLQKKDYSNAVVQFSKAYTNGSGSYLYPHIMYFLAVSCDKSKDYENAVKYYELYDGSFTSGGYEETVLYNLAMIYKDTDIIKAKKYAGKLSQNYAKSIYNNTNIQEILKK